MTTTASLGKASARYRNYRWQDQVLRTSSVTVRNSICRYVSAYLKPRKVRAQVCTPISRESEPISITLTYESHCVRIQLRQSSKVTAHLPAGLIRTGELRLPPSSGPRGNRKLSRFSVNAKLLRRSEMQYIPGAVIAAGTAGAASARCVRTCRARASLADIGATQGLNGLSLRMTHVIDGVLRCKTVR